MKPMHAAALTICVLAAVSARAAEMTGGQLLDLCEAKDATAHNACRYYILGVAEGLQFSGRKSDARRICVPGTISEARFVEVFQAAAAPEFTTYPNDREMPAAGLVTAALTRAFPCKVGK